MERGTSQEASANTNNNNSNSNNNADSATATFYEGQNSRRFGGRWRAGRSTRYGHRNQPVFFGPFAEYSTPPPAVFDIPPRVLPVHMFNANMVPPSERDAQFETQFAPFANQFPPHRFEGEPPRFYDHAPAVVPNDGGTARPSSSSSSSHSHRAMRGGRTRHNVKRGGGRGMGHAHQDIPFEQLSFLNLGDGLADVQEGYGCPPSYVMESYREKAEMAAEAVAASKAHGYRTYSDNSEIGSLAYTNRALERDADIAFREDDSMQTLRDRLKKQLEEESYECMICCQVIRASQWIWTCKKCYHMFHINRASSYGCITQWAAKSFETDVGWRCPSCQNVTLELPRQYRCFCGKKLNPPTQRFPDMPHSCNAICGKSRGLGCTHPCTDQCHPGPCPECPITITQKCNCGQETVAVRCGKQLEFKCSKVCGKVLNCGVHKCEVICHQGECNACEHVIAQRCFCGLEERVVPCTSLNLKVESFSCGAPCSGMYTCGLHKCERRCHEKHGKDDCGLCSLSPEKRKHCPCGRTLIEELVETPRASCTDPIPTCENVCNKVLTCGPKEKPHRCKQPCHAGPCPSCPLNSSIVCRCKAVKRTIPCKEFVFYSAENPYLCERRCKKFKSCQNHRCQAVCCVDQEHVCLQVCGKKLNCGNHNCDRLCHVGQCARCLQASFEEQYCLCGHTVREPPIPCGASLPPCDQPCSRQHSCDHSPMHNCHAEPECPPCTVLTQKPCYGGHEIRANIPCYLNDVSCGRPCDKKLSCGVHHCKRTCHPGSCLAANTSCQQPCTSRRVGEACDHICGLPCHGDTPCPRSVCAVKVAVTCPCLRKSAEMRCADVEKAYQKALSLKVVDETESKQTTRLLKRSPSNDKYCCLPCDAECQRALRNKKVADALNISGSTSAVAAPTYTNFLKHQLKVNYKQVVDIEDTLVELVQDLDIQPNMTSVSHTFRPMHSEQRRIVHEYAGFFGIETISYDQEPQRNVVATAKRDLSHMPTVLLTASTGHAAASSMSASSSSASVASKVVPLISKDYSWTNDSGMQQLQSAGKVLKRGFASQK